MVIMVICNKIYEISEYGFYKYILYNITLIGNMIIILNYNFPSIDFINIY